jgi:hypothetical protein
MGARERSNFGARSQAAVHYTRLEFALAGEPNGSQVTPARNEQAPGVFSPIPLAPGEGTNGN